MCVSDSRFLCLSWFLQVTGTLDDYNFDFVCFHLVSCIPLYVCLSCSRHPLVHPILIPLRVAVGAVDEKKKKKKSKRPRKDVAEFAATAAAPAVVAEAPIPPAAPIAVGKVFHDCSSHSSL